METNNTVSLASRGMYPLHLKARFEQSENTVPLAQFSGWAEA